MVSTSPGRDCGLAVLRKILSVSNGAVPTLKNGGEMAVNCLYLWRSTWGLHQPILVHVINTFLFGRPSLYQHRNRKMISQAIGCLLVHIRKGLAMTYSTSSMYRQSVPKHDKSFSATDPCMTLFCAGAAVRQAEATGQWRQMGDRDCRQPAI
jgi:hypothetical protein